MVAAGTAASTEGISPESNRHLSAPGCRALVITDPLPPHKPPLPKARAVVYGVADAPSREPITLAISFPHHQGRGAGVGRTLGVGWDRGVGVGLGVAVEVALGVVVAVAVGVAVAVAVAVAVGVAVAVAVAVAVGVSVAVAVAVAVGVGVAVAVAVGVGVGPPVGDTRTK